MKKSSFTLALMGVLLLISSQFSFAGAIDGKQYKDWQGRCQVELDKEFCFLLQGFSADGKTPLMITTVDLAQHPKFAIVTLRVTTKLDPTKDIQFKVDKNQSILLQAKCTEKECAIAFPLDKRMLSQFKRGARGVLGFLAKESGEAVYFPVSLSGFTKGLQALKKM